MMRFRFLLISFLLEIFVSFSLQAQSLCDSLYIPRGNMYPPERREICQQDTILLQGVATAGYQMQWYRNNVPMMGESEPVLEVTLPGTYSFRLLKDGCPSLQYDTIRIKFRNQPKPQKANISLLQPPQLAGSSFTLQVNNSLGTSAHSWYRNGILQPAGGSSYSSRNPGRFRVRTDSAGCRSFSAAEIYVNPPGTFRPSICRVFPLEPAGIRAEWLPPLTGGIGTYRIYGKKYYESSFRLIDSVSQQAGFWQNSLLPYQTSYDLMLTARVSGPGGVYESEPSPIHQSVFLKASRNPEGFSPGIFLSWNSYLGFQAENYFIIRDENIIDTLPGAQTSYTDASLNDTATYSYRVEASGNFNCAPVLTDVDGNEYDTVRIGNQVWMKENLRVTKYRNGNPIPTNLDNAQWSAATEGAFSVHLDNDTNDLTYGKLYNWYAVADPRGLCPTGWHVPSDAEWTSLENFLGGASVAGGKMKSMGTIQAGTGLWDDPNTAADNSSGFTGLPGDFRSYNGNYGYIGLFGYWWSSTDTTSPDAWSRDLNYSNANSRRLNYDKTDGFSVRCLKDAPETGSIDSLDCAGRVQMNYLAEKIPAENVQLIIPYTGGNGGAFSAQSIPSADVIGLAATIAAGNFSNGNDSLVFNISGTPAGFGTATFSISIGGKQCNINMNVADTGSLRDIEGNLYTSIKIGTQEWMQQNLKTSKYRNGNSILTNLDNTQWSAATEGAFSVYLDNDTNDLTYGKLYNWYAVAGALCPVDWHVPTDHDWNLLTKYLDPAADTNCVNCASSTIAGGKMKSTGTIQAGTGLWQNPNTDATNSSGFTGLPGTLRTSSGSFYDIGYYGYWWSSTEGSSALAWSRNLRYTPGDSIRGTYDKTYGFSVRCLRD